MRPSHLSAIPMKVAAVVAATTLLTAGIGLDAQETPPADPLPRYARARLGDLRFHHDDPVKQAVFTPDGRSLITLDAAGQVRIWDAATGRTSRTIGDSGHNLEMDVAPDGRSVATVGSLSGLRLWDVATGRLRRRWHLRR